MQHFKLSALLFIPVLLLCACSHWDTANTHRVVCNKLKSDLVFNGATSITRQADIERAEQPLQQRTYDANCDQ